MERVESLPTLKGRGLTCDIQAPSDVEVFYFLKQSKPFTVYQSCTDSRKEIPGPTRVLGAVAPTHGPMPALTPGQRCILHFDGHIAELRVDRYRDRSADVRGAIIER